MTNKSYKKRAHAKDLVNSAPFSNFKSEHDKTLFKNGQYEKVNAPRKQNFEVKDLHNSNKM